MSTAQVMLPDLIQHSELLDVEPPDPIIANGYYHPRPSKSFLTLIQNLSEALRSRSATPAPRGQTPSPARISPFPETAPTPMYCPPTPALYDPDDMTRVAEVLNAPPSADRTARFMGLISDLSSKFKEHGDMHLVSLIQDLVRGFEHSGSYHVAPSYFQTPTPAPETEVLMAPTPDPFAGYHNYPAFLNNDSIPRSTPSVVSSVSSCQTVSSIGYYGDLEGDDDSDVEGPHSWSLSRLHRSPALSIGRLSESPCSDTYSERNVTTPVQDFETMEQEFVVIEHFSPVKNPELVSTFSSLANALGPCQPSVPYP